MKMLKTYYVVAFIVMLLVSGCHRENPVQLNDDDVQSQDIEIQQRSISIEPLDPSVTDTTGFFLPSDKKFYGKFIVAGIEYDSPTEHHEASLAHAILFNRAEPVLFNGDTVGYRADDAGVVSIDNLSLHAEPARLNIPGIPIDSIGTRYSLLNIDGVGGRGFQYFGKHQYQWDIGGSLFLPSFQVHIDAPSKIHILTPTAGENLSRSRNVQMRWQGGGEVVTILISDFQEGSQVKPILHLKLKSNKGRLLLPKRILQLLPENRSRFLFTFSSESSFVMTLYSAYQENILVRAVTSHSLVYYLNR